MKAPFIAVATVLAAVIATPASAMVSQQDVNARVRSAVDGGGNIAVTVDGDTAYLSGWVEDTMDRYSADRAARGTDGIENVVNSIPF